MTLIQILSVKGLRMFLQNRTPHMCWTSCLLKGHAWLWLDHTCGHAPWARLSENIIMVNARNDGLSILSLKSSANFRNTLIIFSLRSAWSAWSFASSTDLRFFFCSVWIDLFNLATSCKKSTWTFNKSMHHDQRWNITDSYSLLLFFFNIEVLSKLPFGNVNHLMRKRRYVRIRRKPRNTSEIRDSLVSSTANAHDE